MIIDITVPELGESITAVEIGEWLVQIGDPVRPDDPLVAIESEKATVEIPAPQGGILVEIVKEQGEAAGIGEVIGRINTAGAGDREEDEREELEQPPEPKQTARPETKVMPSAARVLALQHIPVELVTPTGPGGRILKEDAELAGAKATLPPAEDRHALDHPGAKKAQAGKEHRVPMSLLRRTLAARLLEATQTMAILTTFNEVDMSEVKRLRSELGTAFTEKYGVRLGYMSFFVEAVVAGLRDFPLINARIDQEDIVYHDHCDIGVAIGGGKGLVVPVIRHAEQLNFAQIEQLIALFGQKAQKNTLSPEELKGGTFTISNGGVYGSMLSTPIVNPPQSAILGLHAIKDRPVVVHGEVQVRPVMYLALSYDHRIIDGREAVSFLKGIKERIEQPQKILLEI
jgi:2-oxoglutarate dehydrogenase E2 component (dihydrolipoamide succinyltransferase)